MNAAPHRVLLQTCHFPPLASVGSHRTGWLCRTMLEHGWAVTVQCSGGLPGAARDPALAVGLEGATRLELPAGWSSRRGRGAGRGSRFALALPDKHLAWSWRARRQSKDLDPSLYDLLLTSLPPYSSVLAGRAAQRALRGPWVVDFRDPWRPRRGGILDWLRDAACRRLEQQAIAAADGLIANTEAARLVLAARVQEAGSGGRVTALTNGFDAHRFRRPTGGRTAPGPFTLVHNGSIFPGQRDPFMLLDALAAIVRRGAEPAGGLRLVLSGQSAFMGSAAFHGRLRAAGLGERIVLPGQLSHEASFRLVEAADGLVLLHQSEQNASLVPAKTYEYLAAGRPILCIAPPGAAPDLIERTASGITVRPGDRAALEGALERLLRGEIVVPDTEERRARVMQCSRESLARDLMAFLEGVLAARRSAAAT